MTQSADSRRVMRITMLAGSFFLIGLGLYGTLGGASWGIWVLIGGVLDLIVSQFVLTFIGQRRQSSGEAPPEVAAPSADAPADAAPDPSYNPYARED